jgi:tetratricopeptide (TPR) repeat protein
MIAVDCLVSSTPFANIRHISNFAAESEILFSTHTIFRIGDISEMDDSKWLWRVKLMLTSDNDEELSALTERMREETQGLTGFHRLGQLLITVGEFNKAERVYENIFKMTIDSHEKALLYNQIGLIKDNCGDYTNAIVFYEKSLESFIMHLLQMTFFWLLRTTIWA